MHKCYDTWLYLFIGNFTAWQVQFLFTFIIIGYISFKNTHNQYTYIELAHVCSTNEVNKDFIYLWVNYSSKGIYIISLKQRFGESQRHTRTHTHTHTHTHAHSESVYLHELSISCV